MAKNVVSADGYFSIGDNSFAKGSMALNARSEDFDLSGAKTFTFKFSEIADGSGTAYGSRALAIAGLRAAMFLPEVELVLPA